MTKVALITGASSGIGAAIAIQLAREGHYSLSLVARREDQLLGVAKICNEAGARDVKILAKDLKELVNCQEVIAETISQFKRLDVLISNAGQVAKTMPILEKSVASVQDMMLLNYTSHFVLTQQALPHLERTKGTILYTGSIFGDSRFTFEIMPLSSNQPSAGLTDYCPSKAALHSLAQCVAQEYLTKGVRVNVLAPGAISTAILGDFFDDVDKEDRDRLASHLVPMGRVGKCEEMAHLAAFLVSGHNSFMTGSVIVSDGGHTIDLKLGEHKARIEDAKLTL
eukprot:maker-scaffold64_size435223-snap-gene-2.21 protein:Tk02501 transcript:maker-scaffold64_size435223-snap-gene-2.21-mRNA-1 annotation:"short-chain dehydrogenase reductase sdr domain containing protein"